MRVLIADDEREMTQALEAILKHEHYSVDIVYDGQAALDYGLAETYDCLVLDIMMPKLNGLQVLEQLRENNISTPILLLTAKGQVEDRIEGLNCGADDYLPKPFDVGEFIARVRALTRRNGVFTSHILTVGNISLIRSINCSVEIKRPCCLMSSSIIWNSLFPRRTVYGTDLGL